MKQNGRLVPYVVVGQEEEERRKSFIFFLSVEASREAFIQELEKLKFEAWAWTQLGQF